MVSDKINKIALIGYTGFVGSVLKKSLSRPTLYNSKNIKKIKKKFFKEIICAGLPAKKWIANKYPSKDLKNTNKLINNLKNVNCKLFILISTIDVHNTKESYGKNRKLFEIFIKKKFKNYIIIRLPAIFGNGLKKNILYDLLNNNETHKINSEDKFQWFDLSLLYDEINKLKKKNKFNKIVELYSPPISNKKIIKEFPKISLPKINRKKIIYNYKPAIGYYKNEKHILKRIKLFIKQYEK